MKLFQRKLKLEEVKTSVGYETVKMLTKRGWEITSEYSEDMFDKGIDLDGFTLKKGKEKLNFEWDNWTEWTIEGGKEAIAEVSELLTQQATPSPEPVDRSNG